MRRTILAVLAAVALTDAAPTARDHPPSVCIANGKVTGQHAQGVDSFLGIPYAKPPIGDLRLRPPQPLDRSFGNISLPETPLACINMNLSTVDTTGLPTEALSVLDVFSSNLTGPAGEDCLSINVQRPSGVPAGKKLPVLFWIYGGGWEIGTTQFYNTAPILNLSMSLNEPFVFVAANYRLNAFGFLQGKQLQTEGATNLGLRDQRFALEWVSENIEAFGGDPDRVTIWGESAGAASVFDHLTINNGDHKYKGKALFRAAIMNSGSALPVLPVDSAGSQKVFDTVAQATGCDHRDAKVVDCLRKVPTDQFVKAMNSVPNFMDASSNNLAYIRRPDPTCSFYSQDGIEAARKGTYAKVPIIMMSLEDEATPFAVAQRNIINSTATLADYIGTWFPQASKKTIEDFVATYSSNPADGLPARTGSQCELYPGFKENSAIQTDITFVMWRRIVLSYMFHQVPAWNGQGTYQHNLSYFGTYHTSDLATQFGLRTNTYAGTALDTAYIHFVNHLDPNGGNEGGTYWPRWDERGLKQLSFSAKDVTLGRDDYRWESYEFMKKYAEVLKQ